MAEKKTSTSLLPPHRRKNFRGYTIGELRQQRLLTQVRMELLKEKLINDTKALTRAGILPQGKKSSSLISFAGVGLKLLSYADLFGLGFAIFRSGKKIFRLFRRK